MTLEAQDWLPREAFTTDLVGAAIAVIVEDWTTRWFAQSFSSATLVEDPGAASSLSPPADQWAGRVAAVSMTGRGKRALLEASLGLKLDGTAPTEGDHRLLDAFASRVMRDLAQC